MSDFAHEINGIIGELLQPQNRQLLIAIVRFNDEHPEDKSFMFDFSTSEPMTYLEYEAFLPMMNGLLDALGKPSDDTRSTGERYDEYIETFEEGYINLDMSAQLDAIISKYDQGWSGSVYGYIMRHVAHKLTYRAAN